jgi:hypothetical protein
MSHLTNKDRDILRQTKFVFQMRKKLGQSLFINGGSFGSAVAFALIDTAFPNC